MLGRLQNLADSKRLPVSQPPGKDAEATGEGARIEDSDPIEGDETRQGGRPKYVSTGGVRTCPVFFPLALPFPKQEQFSIFFPPSFQDDRKNPFPAEHSRAA